MSNMADNIDAINTAETLETLETLNEIKETVANCHKRCKDCDKIKCKTEFYKVRGEYVQSYCKECYYNRIFKYKQNHSLGKKKKFTGLSEDKRKYLIQAIKDGETLAEMAKNVGMCASTIYQWKKKGFITE